MGLDQVVNRLEALKTLTKLLLHEIESLEQLYTTKGDRPAGPMGNLNETVRRYEVALICNALLETHGNQTRAARRLGIKTPTLHAKIRRYKIDSLSLFGNFSDEGTSAGGDKEME